MRLELGHRPFESRDAWSISSVASHSPLVGGKFTKQSTETLRDVLELKMAAFMSREPKLTRTEKRLRLGWRQVTGTQDDVHISFGCFPSRGTWCVYLLRLSDGSLYCGCSNDFVNRLKAHQEGRGSRLVRARLPVEVAYIEVVAHGGRSAAQSREAEIKKYGKSLKENMCLEWQSLSMVDKDISDIVFKKECDS